MKNAWYDESEPKASERHDWEEPKLQSIDLRSTEMGPVGFGEAAIPTSAS